jgi:hypothetical protein
MEEGVKLLLSESKMIDAIELCLRNEKDKDISVKRAKDILFKGLWQLLPFGIAPIERKKINKLLTHSTLITLDENELAEVR